MNTSTRLAQIPPSPIRKLVPFASQAKAKGIKVYHLNIGDPDIPTPEVFIQALRHWNINPIGYAQSQGDTDLINSLKTYYGHLGYPSLETQNIQITTGGSEALLMSMIAVANPGEEILTPEPLYANYISIAAVAGVKLVPINTSIQTGFHLPSKSTIEQLLTNKTKAILYCNPNNPTGTAYTQDEIEMLVNLAQEHNLFLLADEVYREFIYDHKPHVSLFSYLKLIPQQAIILDSLSKRYSLCGARIGVLISLNDQVMSGALKIAQARLSSGLIDQKIAAQLTQVPPSYLKQVQQEYQSRRDILFTGLSRINGVIVHKPEGAFYMTVKLPVKSSEDFCQWLLTDFADNQETVMLAPASGFYLTPGLGANEVRIAYVLESKALLRCIELLELALHEYSSL